MKRLILILLMLSVFSFSSMGQELSGDIRVIIKPSDDITAPRVWYQSNDSTFVYKPEAGLTLYFTFNKEERGTITREEKGLMTFTPIEKILRDYDLSHVGRYENLQRRFLQILLIDDSKVEDLDVYEVTYCSAERTQPKPAPVYIPINMRVKGASRVPFEKWSLSNTPMRIKAQLTTKDPSQVREAVLYFFNAMPHSTAIIKAEDIGTYRLSHPHDLWKKMGSTRTTNPGTYYYPDVYLIEDRGEPFYYVYRVEDWEILFPPAPPSDR
ncbi:hypothetical protein [Porphyromonas cangingivalis]|uniref:hypothetical protein n=1 Tax=Porphyromonas cangingivalis TaxID=36874 RepID=UPI00051D34E3|nr:hypothetical protein [Porphyromonas cangingivalis]KGL47957.1 hypothetical protein HQ34_08255 [Porphyromonas cangingivalis]